MAFRRYIALYHHALYGNLPISTCYCAHLSRFDLADTTVWLIGEYKETVARDCDGYLLN